MSGETTPQAPESPTTARPLEMDDDDVQESGTLGAGEDTAAKSNVTTPPAANAAAAAASDEVPPPKPPRPVSEEQQSTQMLKEAFPAVDDAVIKAVLRASGGQLERAFHALLEMTDPEAAERDQPPPPPPRPLAEPVGPTSTQQSQLEADELYARQLAEHYENVGAYEARTANRGQPGGGGGQPMPRGRQQTGLRPQDDPYDREHSFIDDDLPVIKESLRKGFMETQTKVNTWFTTLKKKIDEQFDEEDERQAQAQAEARANSSFMGRPTRDQTRRSADYDRYDADPELLSDDFAGMKFHSDGTPVQAQRAFGSNPNLFKPPPPSKSPRPGEGRKVSFRDTVEDIDAYNASPKTPPKDISAPGAGGAAKASKWQPLSSVDPNPIVENDPFSLGDSDDEREIKDKAAGSKEIKMEDTERLKQATADAMADSLVADKENKGATGSAAGEDPSRKFGKHIQKRQLEVPEYAASFVNYKALKKLIKKLSATPILPPQNDTMQRAAGGPADSQAALQANKATFFFQLERELEKVNAFYLQKEAELKVRLKTLLDKKRVIQSRHGVSRQSAKFTTLQEGFQQFANDLNKLQHFVEINGTAFSKILKKWDKTSKSKTKELYLSRAVEVQPFFNATVISELSDQATTSLQELGAWADGDNVNFDTRPEHVVSSQPLLGTDEGDADTLLLDAVLSGSLEPLKDLLGRLRATVDQNSVVDVTLRERFTRTFLSGISGAPPEALQLLLETGLVDIQSEDDINERNCLHQAAIYGNGFVLEYGLSKGVAVNRTDVYGRVPLHYASMHGRLDMIDTLLSAAPETINLIDHDNYTPLIQCIVHKHLECVGRLLERSARLDPVSDTDHVPLNLACEHGSLTIAELVLKHGARILPDAEGLYPQHLVARSGQTPELLLLLKNYGADLDQIDKLYGWTPLVHAASEGNVPCLQALLDVGADPSILDEKELPAMYYAAWEGHLECMRLLTPFNSQSKNKPGPQEAQMPGPLAPMMGSSAPMPMSLDMDAIPVLELPPPIIPLRRYGHNFLDTKTVVQINFRLNGEQPLIFFHDSKYPAARLTISSKVSDVIPKNVMLPFQEDTRLVSFHIDNFDSFMLDFDVFPAYGAKVIAKTVALPNTFRALLDSNTGSCCLPLFDPRLRAIGQITFHTQVIKPFQGKPLEITDFETYWKATSQVDTATMTPAMTSSTFVTGSSLSGDFVTIYVQHTSDGVPVLWPQWTVSCGGIDVPVSRLTLAQFRTATGSGPHSPLPVDDIAAVHRILATSGGTTLHDAMSLLPKGMHVNIQVMHPTAEEREQLALRELSLSADLNAYVDAILTVVFDHARAQRARGQGPEAVRSVVFSSYNESVCTALNWKQPNFPVFLCNDLGRQQQQQQEGAAVQHSASSVKDAVRTAQSNNFMGLICCERLLDMVPALVDAIKSHGLALVVDKSGTCLKAPEVGNPLADPFPRLPKGVDGELKGNGVLRFNESIDV
ncbi:hypothetical protein C8A00DRAFT_40178 [Chaetomidium leptoderma]|uniref:Ankyrin repeat protein nuc-2 n=1 Tax=Chaetomidium leptoderma TaxID=669021 RepID=A0AAN7A113_9PEZI|nr:hypothetical protein C8A00DRAFT_40178 [Chaetomidium leptoderma]